MSVVPVPSKIESVCCDTRLGGAALSGWIVVVRDGTGARRLRWHTVCGILMHSSLAVTIEGLPLGWRPLSSGPGRNSGGRQRLKRRSIIKKKESVRWLENLKRSTQLLDDPGRCIQIGDRESDIYELFCAAQEI
ncbi:hypothetical protein ACVWYH_001966 [Bradyrhizobium sp. GM24.11]